MNERIKAVREYLGLTGKKFAERIPCTPTFLSQMERGNRVINERTQKLICDEFGVNPEWLRTGVGEMMVVRDGDSVDAFCEHNKITGTTRAILTTYAKLSENSKHSVDAFLDELIDGLSRERRKNPIITREQYIADAKRRTEEEAGRAYDRAMGIISDEQ